MPDPCEEKIIATNVARNNLNEKTKNLSRKLEIGDNERDTFLLETATITAASIILGIIAAAAAPPLAVVAGGTLIAADVGVLAGVASLLTGFGTVITPQIDDINEADYQVKEAVEDFNEALEFVKESDRELVHCSDGTYVEVVNDEETVEDDVTEFHEDDLSDDPAGKADEDGEEEDENDKTLELLVCQECGFMDEIKYFTTVNNDYVCPDCSATVGAK